MTDPSLCYLVDGYISYTFGSEDAEYYMAILFREDARKVVATRDKNGAFLVFNKPSRFSPPTATINGRNAWLVDYAIRSAGTVVPQRLWSPRSEDDCIALVDNAQFHVPVFFVNASGSLGVPFRNASEGNMQLVGGQFQHPLSDNTFLTIRIAWPGYDTFRSAICVKDATPQKKDITLKKLVQIVGRQVERYLSECEQAPLQPFSWRVGHGYISPDEVTIIGIVQVSERSWMPILQLMGRFLL